MPPVGLWLVGAILILAATARAEDYVVRKGETLQRIARDQLGDEERWSEIARLNGMQAPYRISVGQKLRLPEADKPTAPTSAAGAATASATSHSSASPRSTAIFSLGSVPVWAAIVFYSCLGLFAASAILWLVGWLHFLVSAFGQSFWWGIGTILVWPVWLVFLVKYWEKAKKGFIMQMVASGMAGFAWVVLFCAGLSAALWPAILSRGVH